MRVKRTPDWARKREKISAVMLAKCGQDSILLINLHRGDMKQSRLLVSTVIHDQVAIIKT